MKAFFSFLLKLAALAAVIAGAVFALNALDAKYHEVEWVDE